MSIPLAFHISWRTYGTWLPGDDRGWVDDDVAGVQEGDANLWLLSRAQMHGEATTLSPEQRSLVEATIRAHCEIRGWQIHALNARTNHVHVVLTAATRYPEKIRDQFKAWCSRKLNERYGRRNWWAGRGSVRWIKNDEHLRNAIQYVRDGQ